MSYMINLKGRAKLNENLSGGWFKGWNNGLFVRSTRALGLKRRCECVHGGNMMPVLVLVKRGIGDCS